MKPLVIVTHDGTFHADDVFACATLSLVFSDRDIQIIRSRDDRVIEKADIAVDVGIRYDPSNGRFDHHQKGGADKRENGIPYASFGLIWKEYGHMLTGSLQTAAFIDEQVVQGIDGADNGVIDKVADKGVYVYSVIDMIGALRPTWKEDRTSTDAFMDAVRMAITVLNRAIAHTKSYAEARAILERAYIEANDKQIIEIGIEYPGWQEALTQYDEPLFVIYQREDGNWSAKGVRLNPLEFPLRHPFPEAWAGLRDVEFQNQSGVKDAIFCHNNRFIVAARSKEGVYLLARKAISK